MSLASTTGRRRRSGRPVRRAGTRRTVRPRSRGPLRLAGSISALVSTVPRSSRYMTKPSTATRFRRATRLRPLYGLASAGDTDERRLRIAGVSPVAGYRRTYDGQTCDGDTKTTVVHCASRLSSLDRRPSVPRLVTRIEAREARVRPAAQSDGPQTPSRLARSQTATSYRPRPVKRLRRELARPEGPAPPPRSHA